jgi:hypothetical protein
VNDLKKISKLSTENIFQRESEMYDFFESLRYELWEDLYTPEDVEDCFNKCTVIPYKEIYKEGVEIVPLSSGHHLGSANWMIKLPYSDAKIGIMSKSSVLSENRYPAKIDIQELMECDLLILGSIVNESELIPRKAYSYDDALGTWINQVNSSFQNSLMDSKVLLPINPLLLLDVIDLLSVKLNNLSHINMFSKSAD